MGGAGTVDPDQDLLAGPSPGPITRQLAQRRPDDHQVVGGRIGAGVARSQQRRDRLAGPVGAVVEERPQRVMAEPALERRCCAFFLPVGGDQGGVHVDDQRPPGVCAVVGGAVAGQPPGRRASCGAGGIDRGQHLVSVVGEPVDRA